MDGKLVKACAFESTMRSQLETAKRQKPAKVTVG